MTLNLVPGLPLVLLKGPGEELNIPRGQVQRQARVVWDQLRSYLGSVEDEGSRWENLRRGADRNSLAVMSESWPGSYKPSSKGAFPMKPVLRSSSSAPFSPLSSINWSKPSIALHNGFCSYAEYGAIPRVLHALSKMIKNFFCLSTSRSCEFLEHFGLCPEVLIKCLTSVVGFLEPSPYYLARAVLFWCTGYTLGRTFTLSVLHLTGPQVLHLTVCKVPVRATEGRDLGYLKNTGNKFQYKSSRDVPSNPMSTHTSLLVLPRGPGLWRAETRSPGLSCLLRLEIDVAPPATLIWNCTYTPHLHSDFDLFSS